MGTTVGGIPETIISDNAKNFKSSSEELSFPFNTDPSLKHFAQKGIHWQFIAERAPWWGGFYERLIGLMKRCLKKTIGNASLNIFELNTVVIEADCGAE